MGAGNNIDVSWSKDGGDFPSADFDDEAAKEVDGDFTYGQKKAWSSSFTWKQPVIDATCDTVARHNGEYTCTVQAMAGGSNTDDSSSVQVTVQCE